MRHYPLPPTFFCKSVIPGVLLFEFCNDIILRRLAPTAPRARLSFNIKILKELSRIDRNRARKWPCASCKSIIPGYLLCRSRKSIIIGCLELYGFRPAQAFDLARDLAGRECLPGMRLENMTCASLSAWSPSVRVYAQLQRPRRPLIQTYIYYIARVKLSVRSDLYECAKRVERRSGLRNRPTKATADSSGKALGMTPAFSLSVASKRGAASRHSRESFALATRNRVFRG